MTSIPIRYGPRRVLNGRRIEFDGAERKRRTGTEVYTFRCVNADIYACVTCRYTYIRVCRVVSDISYRRSRVIVATQLALFHGCEYLVSGMQIYRRGRISLAYISCFRLRYGRSRVQKQREREKETEK